MHGAAEPSRRNLLAITIRTCCLVHPAILFCAHHCHQQRNPQGSSPTEIAHPTSLFEAPALSLSAEAVAWEAALALVRLFSFLKGLNSSQAVRALPWPACAPWCCFMPSKPYWLYSLRDVGSDSVSACYHGIVTKFARNGQMVYLHTN